MSRGDGDIDEREKEHLIRTSFEVDRMHLAALDRIRKDFEDRGIDIETPEGRRQFVKAVRDLNNRFL